LEAALAATSPSFAGSVRSGSTPGVYTISTFAGARNRNGQPATNAVLSSPQGLAGYSAGNLYIADADAHRVLKVGADGTISNFAGSSWAVFAGDNGPAAIAALKGPRAVAVDSAGNVYIADTGNDRIRKVTPDGMIQTVAGPGVPGVIGDGGPAS